jgi:hypothetical protein
MIKVKVVVGDALLVSLLKIMSPTLTDVFVVSLTLHITQ